MNYYIIILLLTSRPPLSCRPSLSRVPECLHPLEVSFRYYLSWLKGQQAENRELVLYASWPCLHTLSHTYHKYCTTTCLNKTPYKPISLPSSLLSILLYLNPVLNNLWSTLLQSNNPCTHLWSCKENCATACNVPYLSTISFRTSLLLSLLVWRQ